MAKTYLCVRDFHPPHPRERSKIPNFKRVNNVIAGGSFTSQTITKKTKHFNGSIYSVSLSNFKFNL